MVSEGFIAVLSRYLGGGGPRLSTARDAGMIGQSLLVLAAYLLGSVSTGILTCRLLGLPDPRTRGSGNPGATNAGRVGGRRVAAATLAGDTLKGWLPVTVAQLLDFSPATAALAGLAACCGHLFPLFFAFRGGKGVATFLGVMLAAAPVLALLFAAVWLAVVSLSRYVSLASVVATATTLGGIWLTTSEPGVTGSLSAVCLLILLKHRDNLRRLREGREPRVRFGKPA